MELYGHGPTSYLYEIPCTGRNNRSKECVALDAGAEVQALVRTPRIGLAAAWPALLCLSQPSSSAPFFVRSASGVFPRFLES